MAEDSICDNESTPESLLSDLKAELGDECHNISDDHMLMFLHWKPSVDRAAERFRAFAAWKKENEQDFGPTLLVSKDPELERLLLSEVMVAPPNLTTKTGSPILIGRMRNNDMTDGRTVDGVCRMLYYTIDNVLQRPEVQKQGVTVIHDLRRFDRFKNARVEIAKRLVKGALSVFPVKLNMVYFVDAPLVFVGFFTIVSFFIPKKLRDRVRFITNFDEIGVVDPEHLLQEMGGTLEWSSKEWVDEQKRLEEKGANYKSLTTMGAVLDKTKIGVGTENGTVEIKAVGLEHDEC